MDSKSRTNKFSIKHTLPWKLVVIAFIVTVIIAVILHYLTNTYIINQAEKSIQNLLLSHKGVHHYIQSNTLPELYKLKEEGEIPKGFYSPELLSSSYMVRNIHKYYNKERTEAGLPIIYYKMAAINPRNPVNKANVLEQKLIENFNVKKGLKKYRDIIEIDGKKYLYYALPFLETNQACLKCHGNRQAAPKQLINRYPGEGGFGDTVGDIRAVESIRVPLESEFKVAHMIFAALLSGFVIFICLLFLGQRLKTMANTRTIDLKQEIAVRMKTEQTLRESERKCRTLLETTLEGCWLLNPERKTIEVNQALCKMLGYSQDEMLGKTPFEFADDENRKIFIEQTSKISTTLHRSYEITLKKKNGHDLHAYFNATTIKDESGELQGSFAFVTDITNRKLAEKELCKFETIISSVSDPMSYVDKNYIYRTVNNAYTRVFNKSSEEIVGRSIQEMLGQDAFDNQIKGYFDICLGGQEVEYKDWFDFPDGKRRHMHMRYYPFFEKGREIAGIVVAGRDETELELARLDIKHAHSELNQVFNSSIPLCMIEKDYTLCRSNKTFRKLFEIEEETAHRKKCYEVLQTSLCNTPNCPMRQVDSGSSVIEQESKVELSSGRAISCLISASPLESGEGEFLGIVECFMDVTQLNNARKEREKLEAQLQQAQKLESIGTLAGGIAHDFNNILFSVLGYTELALDNIEKGTQTHDNLKEVLFAAHRATDLVKQILAFSRQANQELKPLKVQLVVREVLKLIKASLPSTIEIKYNISNTCGYVLADATQIHQVAMNLLTNAFHAMEDEGGALDITLKEVDLDLDDLKDPTMIPGSYVCLTVTDTGTGIDKSVIDRIFEPYFSTKEKDKGTGLGLAMVHGIVKSYGGDIRVYSETGKGTAFHVYLPVIKTKTETKETRIISPVKRGTERILLVDDEAQIVCMLQQMLENLGYHVTARTSSIETLEAFRAVPDQFDLVITDMTMPNMTGVKLSQKLLEIRPDIPIIICTGFSEKISEDKIKTMGICGYVMKPVIKNELSHKIRKVLDS